MRIMPKTPGVFNPFPRPFLIDLLIDTAEVRSCFPPGWIGLNGMSAITAIFFNECESQSQLIGAFNLDFIIMTFKAAGFRIFCRQHGF